MTKRRRVTSSTTDAPAWSNDFLDEVEIERMLSADKACTRDYALLLLTYRHALRVSEATTMLLDQVDLKQG